MVANGRETKRWRVEHLDSLYIRISLELKLTLYRVSFLHLALFLTGSFRLETGKMLDKERQGRVSPTTAMSSFARAQPWC